MTAFLQSLECADKSATLFLNSLHCAFSDAAWQVFSNREIWYVLYLAVAVALFVRLGWKKGLAVTISIILTVVLCDQLGNVCKYGFARLRPCWDGEMVTSGLRILEERGGDYGFYSAHAANAMGFAVCSLLGFRAFDKSRRYALYGSLVVLWALLAGLSRVFVGKHFLGDVLTGFAAGLLAGWALARLTSLLWTRIRRCRE